MDEQDLEGPAEAQVAGAAHMKSIPWAHPSGGPFVFRAIGPAILVLVALRLYEEIRRMTNYRVIGVRAGVCASIDFS